MACVVLHQRQDALQKRKLVQLQDIKSNHAKRILHTFVSFLPRKCCLVDGDGTHLYVIRTRVACACRMARNLGVHKRLLDCAAVPSLDVGFILAPVHGL